MNQELSLYFHIPLCKRKCPYCHFYVTQDTDAARQELLEALLLELEKVAPQLSGKQIVSIYFGGGTPFLLRASELEILLEKIPFSDDCEITIEANPEEVTQELVQEFVRVGVNRLSLGVQSFDEFLLKKLGRRHTAKKALQAVLDVKKGGIDNVSIDLMFDIPGQTLKSWEATLKTVQSLPITHLSLYNLTFEPKTPFERQKETLLPQVPTQEVGALMWKSAVSSFEEMGLKRYEISAFAKPGFASRHNVGYWTARPFLGLGPSAFSYMGKRRTRNVANLKKYAERLKKGLSPVDFEEGLQFPDDLHELLVIALRLVSGVNLGAFEKRHGTLPIETRERLISLQNEGFLEKMGECVKLTNQGLMFYDTVAETLI